MQNFQLTPNISDHCECYFNGDSNEHGLDSATTYVMLVCS